MTGSRDSLSRVITIARGSTVASVDTFGAHTRRFSVGGTQIVKPSDDGIQTHGGIAVLIPYAGRVKNGRYVFGRKRFQLPTRSDGHAIHGFAKDILWKVKARTKTSVSLAGVLRGRGYPGTLAAKLSYSVREGVFTTDCVVRNTGRRAAPIVVGFHPYLVAKGWSIRTSAHSYHYQLADGYFPTGKKTRYSFDDAGPTSRLDDCFISGGTVRLFTGRTVVTLRRRKMPYLVVYNGKYAEGRSVAIEPYSGLPDAYNNGIGLRTLSPGQTFGCGYDLFASKADSDSQA